MIGRGALGHYCTPGLQQPWHDGVLITAHDHGCAQSFGRGLFPGAEQTPQVQLVEQRYAAAIKRELKDKVNQSLQRKLEVRQGSPSLPHRTVWRRA